MTHNAKIVAFKHCNFDLRIVMGLLQNPDEYFMLEALKEAEIALSEDEVPIGAIITSGTQIIAKAHNLVERLNDPTAHAEMQAITQACNFFNSKYIPDCTIYITLEPCTMCATGIFWSQIGRVVFGAADPKLGFTRHQNILYPKTQIQGGILAERCSQLIIQFFKGKR